jgi:hypothetical protein
MLQKFYPAAVKYNTFPVVKSTLHHLVHTELTVVGNVTTSCIAHNFSHRKRAIL